jgi:hypothetical protein
MARNSRSGQWVLFEVYMRKSLAILIFSLLGAAAAALALEAPADKAETASGTVVTVQASQRTVSVALADGTEARFAWNAETKINGVLAPGAKVTIRYTPGANGKNVALQITVARS